MKRMRRHQSDRLIRTRLLANNTNKERDIFLFLLFEHKSRAEPLTPLQLLRYMVRIWEQQRANKERLTPIIPVVFYHGDREWHISTEFQALFNDLPEAAKRYVPSFEYILQDYSWRKEIPLRQNRGE